MEALRLMEDIRILQCLIEGLKSMESLLEIGILGDMEVLENMEGVLEHMRVFKNTECMEVLEDRKVLE